MSTGTARVRDLTNEEIANMKKSDLKKWLDRAMSRLFKLLTPHDYHERCECWACQKRLTVQKVREFLIWARDTIREKLSPKVAPS
jgi:hypothetical protein